MFGTIILVDISSYLEWGCYICSLDMIPYPGCGSRSARAMLVGSRERGCEVE